MKNRMNIFHVGFPHAQTTKTTTNKTKAIQDYLSGSSVQKSTCSHQLGSSIQFGYTKLIPRESFCTLYAQRVNLFGMRAVVCLLPATCALYHDV
jgi:hypothetical protein